MVAQAMRKLFFGTVFFPITRLYNFSRTYHCKSHAILHAPNRTESIIQSSKICGLKNKEERRGRR